MAMITPALLQSLFTGFKKNFEDARARRRPSTPRSPP